MTRVNQHIRAPKIRVVMDNGDQLGVMSSQEALQKAKSLGLDLVEITAKSDPPVCKICDFGKHKYQMSKLKKGKVNSAPKLKEIKFRVRTEDHDYNLKCSRIEKFLDEGSKVKVGLMFRGRENAHKELGVEVLKRVVADMVGMAAVDQPPRLAGRNVNMLLSPLPEEKRVRKFTAHDNEEYVDEDDTVDEEE
ncbi:MAG: translation initiation factor IF-3 [Rubritalea sp.]|jgi:translation initiation factor IF-3